MKYHYLFCDHHNGYYRSYIPFTTEKNLTQEDATKFILMRNPIAGRVGSSIEDLMIVANDHEYNFKRYFCEYRDPRDEPMGEPTLDDLPSSFDNWKVIDAVSGNY